MGNSEALSKGSAKARKIIDKHIGDQILPEIAKGLLDDAVNGRIFQGHNMTGNTVNSYTVGIYVRGELARIITPSGQLPHPLRRKLGQGQRFYAGSQRWDGEMQEHTFTAKTATNGTIEAERSIAFLQSYQANPKGWELVVCNGVEYATFQENEMNIDVLTSNFECSRMLIPSMLKPLSE